VAGHSALSISWADRDPSSSRSNSRF